MKKQTKKTILEDNARSELWRRGVIAPWYLQSHQFPLYNLVSNTERDIVIPNICRRFGKSTTCVSYAIEQALKSKQDIRYATAFLTDLQGFIKPIFDDILSSCPQSLRPDFLEYKKIYKFKNGSTIKLIGIDKNPDGIRGNAIDILIIDEAGFVDNLEYLYRSIIVPATANRKFKIIFPSTPPESPEHFWAKELIPKAQLSNTYLMFTIDDNTSLPDEEKARLIHETGGPNSVTTRREWYCEILVDEERAICPTFNEKIHVKDVKEPDFAHWICSTDTGGVNDLTDSLLLTFDYARNKIIVLDERWFNPHTPTPIWLNEIKEMEGNRNCSRPCDASGQLLVDLSALGYSCYLPRKDEFNAGLSLLRDTFYRNEIEIHPRCKLLIATLKGGLLNKQRTDFERTKSLGHADAVAALIYGIRHINRNNPFPPSYYGLSHQTHFIPNNPHQQSLEANLKQAFTWRRK